MLSICSSVHLLVKTMGLEAPGGIKMKLAMIVVVEIQADPAGVVRDERNLLRAVSGTRN
jgi:hypothetical protein